MSHIPPDQNSMFQQLMNNMTDNIFFKDRDSKFIMVNEADAKWLGLNTPEELVGKSDFDLFTEEFARVAREDERRVMETGEPMISKEEKETRPDGHTTWVSTTKIPLRDDHGQIVGCIGIGRDITEIKQKEFELQEAYQRLRQANQQIEEDLRMAANLQKTLLPDSYPVFPAENGQSCLDFHHFYQADIELGGDFCSIYQISDTQAGLLICDVMGHGVRAALITGIIRTLGQEIASKADSPGAFLAAMNQRLFPLLRTSDAYIFVTACYVTIDTVSGELAGANAGHPLPFLIEPQQGQVASLGIAGECAGPALAIIEDYDYQTFSKVLAPGNQVLMYTDGLCEAMNRENQQFGEGRLQELIQAQLHLPLQDRVPQIVQAVGAFTGGNKFGDDICMLGFALNALKDNS